MSTCSESSVYWEIAHVQKVYNLIAPHYNDVKHRTWPKVNKFLKNLAPGSLVADVGCGNGRYLSVNPMIYKFGSDICTSFLEQARLDGYETLAADNIALPYRDGVFDAVCSIGVIHHFSSRNRRIRAIQELARITSSGGKLMIYVWAYEQTRRKFTSQDVLIPWIKPELGGSSRTKLSDMEVNASCSFDNADSQDEQLLPVADHTNASGDSRKTLGQTNAHHDKPTERSQHAAVQSSFKRSDVVTDGVFNCESGGNINKEISCANGLSSEDGNDIDERDVEWTPVEADRPLAYPKQLVSECKKVGKLLRYLTTTNECRDSPDTVLGEDERYADSCDEVQLNSETSAMFRFNGGYIRNHNVEAHEKVVCDSSSMTITSYPPRETSDEDSAASTLRLLEDCPSSSLFSPSPTRDPDIVWGTNISESIVRASCSVDDTTALEDSLEDDSSSSNTSYDSEGSQLSADETLTFSDSFSKSTYFDPFSRSPPEVPSDTSISESNHVYTELNSRLAVLNSNRRDEPCFQSVHYVDDDIRQKAPYTNIKHAIPLNQPFPAKDADTNISAMKNSVSQSGVENRTSACPQNTTSNFQHKDVSRSRKEIAVESNAADDDNKVINQSSQTKSRELFYLFAIRQNMKNLYAKFADAYQANKKCRSATKHKHTAQGVPPTTIPEPMTRAKREDQVTLQYYREVCYFPPNNQYQSMKSCLGKNPVPSAPKLIQGRRHSLLGFARRFSGAKDKTAPQPKSAVEENRKLSLSDALTMIGDGYSEDYIEDKLDSAAKKMFVEMRKVNFGIRQFPRSSVEENQSPSGQTGFHLNVNNSLSDVKETARQITGRVVDTLQDGLKHISQDTLHNALVQLAGDTVQNGLVHIEENTGQKGLVQLAENTIQNGIVQLAETKVQNGIGQLAENAAQIGLAKLHQHTPFSLSQTFESFDPNRISNDATLKHDQQLQADTNLKPTNNSAIRGEMPRDMSNNATTDGSVGTEAKPGDAPIVDTMIDVSPLPIAQIIGGAVSAQPTGTPPRAPELCDRKRIISSLSRYYHVFREGELENLILDHVPSLLIVDSYFDHANWCVVAEKL